MKAASFDYVRPKSLAEASAALTQAGVATAVIAGGQSLVPMLNLRVALVDLLVDISRLDELKGVSETSAGISIGALTSHAAIEDGNIPDLFGGLLRRVGGQISYRAVRNYGTIGGSVALADPAADWPGCLMALGASVRIWGSKGARTQPAADFVVGAYETALTPGEIIVGFDLPRPSTPPRWGYAKVVRKSGAFASSIAFVIAQGKGGPVSVVLGAAGPRARALPNVARQVQAEASAEDALRKAIADDLAAEAPHADAYEQRMHTATILRAVREMRAQ